MLLPDAFLFFQRVSMTQSLHMLGDAVSSCPPFEQTKRQTRIACLVELVCKAIAMGRPVLESKGAQMRRDFIMQQASKLRMISITKHTPKVMIGQ